MNSVIIRCPNCGTEQSTLGECDACHEAEARYFCTNHEPGQWLDGPSCPACGARFGVRPAARPTPPPRSTLGRRPLPPDEPERIPDVLWRVPGWPPRSAEVEATRASDPRSPWPEEPPLPVAVSVVPIAGCLRRLVVTILVLLALGALLIFGLLTLSGQVFGANVPNTLEHGRAGHAPEAIRAKVEVAP